jgi:hypothetical protein
VPVTATPTARYTDFTFLLSRGGSTGGAVEVFPALDTLGVSFEPGPDNAYYFREKLRQLSFSGDDYRLLYGVENSADRCDTLHILLEARAYAGGPVGYQWRGTFTCSEVDWNPDQCIATVTPTPADGYQELFEEWDRPVNLLDMPAFATDSLRTVKAQLAELPQGQSLEFKRIDVNEQADTIGTDGWAQFLTNTSFIGNGLREHHLLVFRYVLKDVPMKQGPSGDYEPRDLSGSGWQFYTRNDAVSPPTADYVKAPEISGFKPYTIGTFNDWWHTEGGRRPKYGDTLLLLNCGQKPSDVGFANQGYIEVTGTGGAFNQECGTCLNLRRNLRNDNCKSLWWKFGQFSFSRCFPLLDGLYYLLQQTAPDLLPPTSSDLSSFYHHPTNPVTGATGAANELPTLLLSAGSDVKRYGSSEPATRLLVSLKDFVADLCTLHDLGYYIDPVTGWFQLEHRSFFEAQQNGLTLDFTRTSTEPYAEEATVPRAYSYLSDQLPRYEQLQVSGAVTEEFDRGVSFTLGEIEYSGACVNAREGQNTASRSASRLTGDVAGLVLSGDALPDSAIAVLAVNADGSLRDGNRALAASELLRVYHRYGRVRPTGIVRASTTEEGSPTAFNSVRRVREQAAISAELCTATYCTPYTVVRTPLSLDGRLAKADMNLVTGIVSLTVRHPAPESDQPAPLLRGRQFNNSFDQSAG